uniref:Uma2 family endonuclease n=1 Tax=Agathobacter sp. TaxID=2021311 RepID=UPI00405738E7
MTIEQMQERKKELGYSYEQISNYSGIPLGTVQKVLGGVTKSPRYDTLYALERVLKQEETTMVRESVAYYHVKKQGEYTIEDYFALPEGERAELIDGRIYDMAAPHVLHQAIAGELDAVFRAYIRSKKGQCVSFGTNVDVQLESDDKTIVQPDVLVVCDRNKFQQGRIVGVPDLIIEIISPSTAKRDRTIKLAKYMEAGVREYWIIDPQKKRIIAYAGEDMDVSIYTFEDTIPVGIFDGECVVDFKEIYEYVRFLYER